MKIAGIIAEYNPFHNGHRYQLETLRERTGADFIIIAMSGDFVQRGEPAVYDKYTRARMALNAGADLVLELPAAFAASSAEDFASCGAALLDRLGAVDLLCFGSECGSLDALLPLARLLAREPEEYTALLKERLCLGDSFPKARAWAASEWLKREAAPDGTERAARFSAAEADTAGTLLASPNNILGIEYLKALIRRGSTITPYTIRRSGQGYHDSDPAALTDRECFASASAIRRALRDGVPVLPQLPGGAEAELSQIMPIFADDLSAWLNYRLLELDARGTSLTDYADVSSELADRIRRHLLETASYTERISQLKTRQYTYTRISRALLHILLGTTTEQIQALRACDYAAYARILGFRRDAGALLSELKQRSRLPLISKVADAERVLNEFAWPDSNSRTQALHSFRYDLYCSHLYQSAVYQKSGVRQRSEYTHPIVIV